MQNSTITNGMPAVPVNCEATQPIGTTFFTRERQKELRVALEMPFDPSVIKWRVTNTARVSSQKGFVTRGQVLAYADPRAYTDRLNELFGPSGWTRDYGVQVVQNFERKERGSNQRTITAKIVVTCKVTVYSFATHTGLGEEWADNDNAGTAAEAQAFKRACSCFGLGRYLYDVAGQWVDLDENKHPLETPKLPEWARPETNKTARRNSRSSRQVANGLQSQNPKSTAKKGRGGLYRDELVEQVKALCGTVGSALSKSVLQSVANTDDPDKIRDMAKLTMAFEKLQDTARGVDRLRKAVTKAGDQTYSALCRELNLASESIDDIPDRAILRNLIRTLEGETGTDQSAPKQ
jgi:hypothetical protein